MEIFVVCRAPEQTLINISIRFSIRSHRSYRTDYHWIHTCVQQMSLRAEIQLEHPYDGDCIGVVTDVVIYSKQQMCHFPQKCSLSANWVKNVTQAKWLPFANYIFECIFIKASIWNFPEIVPVGPFENSSMWVQVMTWRCTGDKLLPEPIVTQSTEVSMHSLVSRNLGPGVF